MADLEKVIKGLECHAEVNCVECPYRDGWRTCPLGETLLADALALLKEQEAETEKLRRYVNGFSRDAIPVVRCKDCKYRSEEMYDYYHNPNDKRYVCQINDLAKKPDWYCADGKRREDDA